MIPNIIVVDNFLPDPDKFRQAALSMPANVDVSSYKAKRTARYHCPQLKPIIEALIGAQITDWDNQPFNTCFHFTTPDDPIVYHSDDQNYAGAIYLTPNAPLDGGTAFWRSKATGLRFPPNDEATERAMYWGKLLDRTAWDLVDRIGNVYNRLALWNGRAVHSGDTYFGFKEDMTTARLVMLFFFNVAA